MDGLSSILSNYDDEDEDDELEEDIMTPSDPKELSNKLPLPSIFKSQEEPTHPQCQSDQDGKIRNFAHERGAWASFIYIPLYNEEESINPILNILTNVLTECPENHFKLNGEFHISLSKTLILRHHWIQSLVNSLRTVIISKEKFDLTLDKFEAYTNDEKTRTFIAMKCYHSQCLLDLIKCTDKCLAEYNLDPYYKDPSFHISLAWASGNELTSALALIPLLNGKWESLRELESDVQFINIDKIEFKSGNKLFKFVLS